MPGGKQEDRRDTEEMREKLGDAPFRGHNPSPGIQNMHPLEMYVINIDLFLTSNMKKGEISTEPINSS